MALQRNLGAFLVLLVVLPLVAAGGDRLRRLAALRTD